MKGIDVSQHNGVINWEVAKNNIDFAILRLGWVGNRCNHTLDTQFERNYSECKRLGIPVGVYVYNYCSSTNTIKNGAEWTVNKLNGKSLELPVYIDMEDDSISRLGKNVLTEIVFEFNKIIEASGRWAGVYANKNWFDNYLHNDQIKARFTTWIAHYGVNQDKYKGVYDILQYSESGNVSGVGSNCDMNIMYRDLVNDIKGNKSESEPVQLKSTEEIAQEVIDDKWGTGEDRKNRLEAAGYNYTIIQNRVNEMLKNNSYYPACNSKYGSLVDALNSIGVDSSFNNRKSIAQKNNVHDYTGTANQNNQLLSKLKAGRLKK